MKKFNLKQFIVYHIRWQSGFIVSFPVMYICQQYYHMSLFWSVFSFQFVGACLFYFIDKLIFSEKKKLQTSKKQLLMD